MAGIIQQNIRPMKVKYSSDLNQVDDVYDQHYLSRNKRSRGDDMNEHDDFTVFNAYQFSPSHSSDPKSSLKRHYCDIDMMNDSGNDESYQLSKKLCHIEISPPQQYYKSRTIDQADNTSESRTSSKGVSSSHSNNNSTANDFLRELHKEKINRRRTSGSTISSESDGDKSHDNHIYQATIDRWMSPNSMARMQPYYEQPHHRQQPNSYTLQYDPQYQDRLSMHRESYQHRVDMEDSNAMN